MLATSDMLQRIHKGCDGPSASFGYSVTDYCKYEPH